LVLAQGLVDCCFSLVKPGKLIRKESLILSVVPVLLGIVLEIRDVVEVV
jgi:hypothetical protein